MSTKLGTVLADFTTQLTTQLAIGGTTATLASAVDDDGVALPTGIYFLSLDGSNSQKEHIVCTLTGTALTAISSVSRQGVQTSGAVRLHRVGATVTLTDFATLRYLNDLLKGTTMLDSSHPLEYDGTALINAVNQLATKAYVDAVAIAGGSNASTTIQGFVEIATQAEYDAGTSTGGTGAFIVSPPNITRGKKYNDYAVDSIGTDSYAITITPAITAYVAGQEFTFKAGTANTGSATLNVSGLGAITIKKNVSSDLTTGDILVGQVVKVIYDGTNMQLLPVIPAPVPTVQTFLASGTYTKPAGMKYAVVQLWGGGAGGASFTGAGNGGGGGAYNTITLLGTAVGATETITIGAGGAGATNAAGQPGGNSSFGSFMTVYGGGASGGGGGTMSVESIGTGGAPAGGAPGTTDVGGSSTFGGGGLGGTTGGNGKAGGQSYYGGGGGGKDTGGNGGPGGNSYYGGGGGGAGGSANAGGTSVFGGAGGVGQTNPTAGGAGSVPGGGGGGQNTNTLASGAGAAGKIIVTEFY